MANEANNSTTMTSGMKKTYSDKEKRSAAYALNMCTVSVSQIVDYNDSYILEQEYDAILNNLNLKEMPKDEALLRIISELLNTITFFRIQDIKKQRMEKKYNQRVRNAIWSAIPSLSVIVSGNPGVIAMSLATQIGTGYMNYRREKNNAKSEMEDEEIELEITALEQLNALKRELFTTAWRLAAEYDFDDEYRLSERQIHQYNRILMDQNEIRKFERLEAIKDQFKAYLPFWYQLGHTAAYIAGNKELAIDSEVQADYYRKAKEYFEDFYKMYSEYQLKLLRNDYMVSAYALEYADLLMMEDPECKNSEIRGKIENLLSEAEKTSGNANDILELCAIGHLKCGNYKDAERILRYLVNEEYNTKSNAKILSRIYASQYLNHQEERERVRIEYTKLANKVDSVSLFPFPTYNENDDDLQKQYFDNMKRLLFDEYKEVYMSFEMKYIPKFNRLIPLPNNSNDVGEDLFSSSLDAESKRRRAVENELNSARREIYLNELAMSSIRTDYIDLINEFLKKLDAISYFRDNEDKIVLVSFIRGRLTEAADRLEEICLKIDHGSFGISDYDELCKLLSIQYSMGVFFDELKSDTKDMIEQMQGLNMIDSSEIELINFCDKEDLPIPNGDMVTSLAKQFETDTYFKYSILGEKVLSEEDDKKREKRLIQQIVDKRHEIIKDSGAQMLIRGDGDFNAYFMNKKLNAGLLKWTTLLIIDDTSKKDRDLLLTWEGGTIIEKNKRKVSFTYNDLSLGSNKQVLRINQVYEYSNDSVDIAALFDLARSLQEEIQSAGIRKRIIHL